MGGGAKSAQQIAQNNAEAQNQFGEDGRHDGSPGQTHTQQSHDVGDTSYIKPQDVNFVKLSRGDVGMNRARASQLNHSKRSSRFPAAEDRNDEEGREDS